MKAVSLLGLLALAACTDPRARPVPPILSVILPGPATSPDTLDGSIYAYDVDGLSELELLVRTSDSGFALDTTEFLLSVIEVNRELLFHVPGGRPAGSTFRVIVRVRDDTGFMTADTVDFALP